jgi:hypothetical protein
MADVVPGNRYPRDRKSAPLISPRQVAGMAGDLGVAFTPGSGIADAVFGSPSFNGGNYPSMYGNIKQGNYLDALMQAGGVAGDLLAVMGPPGWAAGGALKAATRASRFGDTLDVAKAGHNSDNMTREERRLAMKFTEPEYHSTYSTFDSFDLNKSDVGPHVGTIEQANERLKGVNPDAMYDEFLDSGQFPDGTPIPDEMPMEAVKKTLGEKYGITSNAQIMPLYSRSDMKYLVARDAGNWSDSDDAARAIIESADDTLPEDAFQALQEVANEAEVMRSQFENALEWKKSPENRALLDEVRSILEGAGFDGIKYHNLVENKYGRDSGFRWDVEKRKKGLMEEAFGLRNTAETDMSKWLDERGHGPESFGKMMDSYKPGDDFDTMLDSFSKKRKQLEDEFNNIDPRLTRAREMEDEAFKLESPENKNSVFSKIIFDPEKNLRSQSAQFKKERGNLMAGLAAGGVGLPMLHSMMQDRERNQQ